MSNVASNPFTNGTIEFIEGQFYRITMPDNRAIIDVRPNQSLKHEPGLADFVEAADTAKAIAELGGKGRPAIGRGSPRDLQPQQAEPPAQLSAMTDEWIAAGNYSQDTVTALRDALRSSINELESCRRHQRRMDRWLYLTEGALRQIHRLSRNDTACEHLFEVADKALQEMDTDPATPPEK